MKQIAEGSEKAFTTLFRRHSNIVLGYSSKLLNSRSLGEDIAQEIWMKVVKMASSYQDTGQFKPWILTMTRNASFDYLRRQKFLADAGEDFAGNSEDVSRQSIESLMAIQENISRVQKALAELPVNQRAALLLWMTEDLSYDQIAHELDSSVSSVKSLLFRARETLTAKLKGSL